ncbi:translation initiation factor eIF3 subunit g [Puccinia graminis f. sp. tritici]|uniref:Translation initiation factor eIF3 subunit g n=1 Tax=Puccinia graminis f. sp. tritici TaxID=56615 RepID=A0A5B0MVJ2_PUCGR|nr:translation initiation factor eIF3 subunit g [Puccinia graminis f. sp. tritici]
MILCVLGRLGGRAATTNYSPNIIDTSVSHHGHPSTTTAVRTISSQAFGKLSTDLMIWSSFSHFRPGDKNILADELDEDELPPSTEKIDPVTGIKTIVEYKWDETGEKKIKTKGKKSGPDLATTTLGEAIKLKIAVPGLIKEPVVEQTTKATIVPGGKRITCRLCQGDHFTASCPYKDTLGGVLGGDAADQDQQDGPGASQAQTNNAAGGGTGKYVPPSQRDGAKRGESMQKSNRDDLPTAPCYQPVRGRPGKRSVGSLWEIRRISRIYVGKDQETGLCKGFAFVSFEDRMEAERAMKKNQRSTVRSSDFGMTCDSRSQ